MNRLLILFFFFPFFLVTKMRENFVQKWNKKVAPPHHYALYLQNEIFRFPKIPLLGYRTQPRRDFTSPPAGSASPPPRSSIPTVTGGGGSLRRLPEIVLAGKHENIPAAAAFIAAAGAALGESRAGLDGQCGHLLRLEAVPELAERQREVELPWLQLVVVADRRYDVVEIHLVGVADEKRRILLQHVGDLNRIRIFL